MREWPPHTGQCENVREGWSIYIRMGGKSSVIEMLPHLKCTKCKNTTTDTKLNSCSFHIYAKPLKEVDYQGRRRSRSWQVNHYYLGRYAEQSMAPRSQMTRQFRELRLSARSKYVSSAYTKGSLLEVICFQMSESQKSKKCSEAFIKLAITSNTYGHGQTCIHT